MFDHRDGHIGQKTTAVQTHTNINKWKRTKAVTKWTARKSSYIKRVLKTFIFSFYAIDNCVVFFRVTAQKRHI